MSLGLRKSKNNHLNEPSKKENRTDFPKNLGAG